jgi:uncharacterized protein (TIGR03663 family)
MSRARVAGLAILLVGAAIRLYDLTLNPFHHDEGVNGFFLRNLIRDHNYKYDPQNYHGPSLYFVTWPFVKLFGMTSFAVRLEPVLFGIGVLVLVLLLARRLGEESALWGAALLAVSPGMVYISRYFIHEMMLLFFTLGVILSLICYKDRPSIAAMFSFAASLGFLFTTKETTPPMLICLAIAYGMTVWVMRRSAGSPTLPSERVEVSKRARKRRRAEERITAMEVAPDREPEEEELPHQRLDLVIWALCIFMAIYVLLFQSFFVFRHGGNGVYDSFRAFSFWTQTGESAHVHPFFQYVRWMWSEEPVVLVLGTAGIALAFALRSNAFAVFTAFWSCGMLLMYSIIKYKTPWLTVNIVLPFGIVAGWGVAEMGRLLDRNAAVLVGIIAIVVSTWLCVDLNFRNYDNNDDRYVYVYAHTVRDINRLLHDVDELSRRAQGNGTRIAIVAREYWPLPWYLRDYTQALFWGRFMPVNDVMLAIASPEEENQVRQSSGGLMDPVGVYDLRPGVKLVLWARKSLGRP